MNQKTNTQRLTERSAPVRGDDFFATPEAVTNELLKHVHFEGEIWEPACGEGHISEVLKRKTLCPVFSSDLVDRGYGDAQIDFLLMNNRKTDNIVTNPPFKLAQGFLEEALRVASEKVVMLLPVRYETGKERIHFFRMEAWSKKIVIPYKIDFTNKNNPMFECAWYVWDKRNTGPAHHIVGDWHS